MRYLVTRHAGALAWMQQQGYSFDQHLTHLPPHFPLQAGDVVIGTLPIPLVAQLTAQGVDYWHLSFAMPAHWRGTELSATQLNQVHAQLTAYRAVSLQTLEPDCVPCGGGLS